MLKVIELFGGIGSPRKALERLKIGFKVVDYVEIDKFAVKSYNAMYGENYEPQDICNWNKDIEADLIFHGSPCQDFSIAGKQAGADENSGTRSSLMYETIRIVKKIKSKYVIWENVPNVLSAKHRHNFDKYLGQMEELGYTNYYEKLNAKDYGIPQNRERVFTVSILGGEKYNFPKGDECNNKIDVVGNYMPSGHDASRIVNENGLAPTVKENHGTVTAVAINFAFPPKQELKLKLRDMLEDDVDEKYYLSETVQQRFRVTDETFKKNIIGTTAPIFRTIGQRDNVYQTNSIMGSLVATDYKQPKQILIKEATKKGYKEAYEGDGINLSYPKSETRRGRVGKQVAQTLTTSCNQAVVESFITKKYKEFEKSKGYIPNMFNPYHKSEINDIAPTQTTNCGGTTSSATVLKRDDLRIRKLTPLECWRLMGFDDEDFYKAQGIGNSNSQLYKQARK